MQNLKDILGIFIMFLHYCVTHYFCFSDRSYLRFVRCIVVHVTISACFDCLRIITCFIQIVRFYRIVLIVSIRFPTHNERILFGVRRASVGLLSAVTKNILSFHLLACIEYSAPFKIYQLFLIISNFYLIHRCQQHIFLTI